MAAAVPDKSLCDLNQCIPSIFKTDDGPEERCATYNEGTCFIPSDVEKKFYKKINWPELRRIIDVEMKSFMNLLNGLYINNTDGFHDLVNLVYPGIVARVGGNELFFKAADLVKNDQHQHLCNDVNYSFSIECQRYPGGKGKPAVSDSATKEFRLFHIAIHSEMPKYHKKDDGRTRSQYACGYFERKQPSGKDVEFAQRAAEGAVAARVTGSGPFHYKIDNYDILPPAAQISGKQCDVKIHEIICPYKRFEPEIDDSTGHATGKFQVLRQGDVGFVNLFAEWSFDAIASFSERFKENDDHLQTLFAHLHSYIYKKFVAFWNDVIFPKVDSQRLRSEATHKIIPIIKRSHIMSKKKYLDSIRSTAADVVSKIVSNSLRKYNSSKGGSRKRNAKRRLTKKMKNRRRRVKK
jgi:hypothetical protein